MSFPRASSDRATLYRLPAASAACSRISLSRHGALTEIRHDQDRGTPSIIAGRGVAPAVTAHTVRTSNGPKTLPWQLNHRYYASAAPPTLSLSAPLLHRFIWIPMVRMASRPTWPMRRSSFAPQRHSPRGSPHRDCASSWLSARAGWLASLSWSPNHHGHRAWSTMVSRLPDCTSSQRRRVNASEACCFAKQRHAPRCPGAASSGSLLGLAINEPWSSTGPRGFRTLALRRSFSSGGPTKIEFSSSQLRQVRLDTDFKNSRCAEAAFLARRDHLGSSSRQRQAAQSCHASWLARI